MDYKTRPISRDELRAIAKYIRHLFRCKNKYRFDAVSAFEKVHKLFPNITVAVVEDDELPKDNPARCIPDFNGGYHIEVANTVYEGAVNGVGGYRDHIVHELSHAFLCMLGFTPVLDRQYKENELKPYESMEWQAKALCGEIMVPYDLIEGLTIREIRSHCKVSYACAEKAIKNIKIK